MTTMFVIAPGRRGQAAYAGVVSPERMAEIAAPHGDVDALNARMEQHRQACVRLDRDRQDLLERHPDRWVAMGPDGLLAVADTHQDLLDEIKASEYAGEFATEFLDSDPKPLFL